MFLSKKNAQYLNKPPKNKKIEIKALPGWDDNQQSDNKMEFKTQSRNNNSNKQIEINLLGQKEETNQTDIQNTNQNKGKQGFSKKIHYNWDQLNEMNNIECQKRLVQSIVEPVGVKIKPTQNLLTQFVKQSKSMDPAIVGSLLLSKIQQNYPFLVKAKSLYTIQHLVKKNQVFENYFKSQNNIIKNSPQPEDNVEQYRKILKNVLNIIGVKTQKPEMTNESQGISYVDPGYNDPKQQSQIKGFLSNNEKIKKPVGPSTKKFVSPNDVKNNNQAQKKNADIFDIFDQGVQTKTSSKDNITFDDLISLDQTTHQQKNIKNITFDDLLK